nr:hypothetical protein [Tanacetum cinerariifolium]
YNNDNQARQFGNQRTLIVVGARENVGSLVVQQTRIQCFNYKEFGHFVKECRKPKRVKDFMYHKENMLLCKQAEQGVPLQAEQSNWLADTDEEIDEQELEAYYIYIEKIQENDQNAIECDDNRVALANLIVNLKHDVDENKRIQKKLKKSNASLTQELTECKSILAKTIALQNKQTEFEKYKACNYRTVDYDKVERRLNETLRLLAQKDIDIKEEREQYFEIQDLNAQLQENDIAINELKKLIEKFKGKSVETKFDKPSVVRQPNAQRIPKPSVLGKPAPFSDSLERKSFSKTKTASKTNVSE